MIALALQIAAFVLFVLGTIGIPAGRYNIVSAGLACWVLSALLARL